MKSDWIRFTGSYTDFYELTMAEVYFLSGRQNERAVFDYFFRKLPFDGGYVVFAGLADALRALEELHFSEDDLYFLKEQNFNSRFIDFLKDFRFRGAVDSCTEGEIVFPIEPVLRVEGSLIETQIIETLLLNLLNFQSLIATKASRIRFIAPQQTLIDFGLRRAQGPGGYYASRAALIGGFDGTSNVLAARDFGASASGTMAHSFIQSEEDEISAFRRFAQWRPEDVVLLIDTYNTLESGISNAIRVAKEMEERGERLKGVRLDSGDLAYLSRRCRNLLDEAGLSDVKITASNQLDEHVIKSLLDQKAPIDVFGVGTSLVVGRPDAALDGVYKLSMVNDQPRIKFSESVLKVNLPHKKQVWRFFDEEKGFLGADAVSLDEEADPEVMHHPFEPYKSLSLKGHQKERLLTRVMEGGRRQSSTPSIKDIQKFSRDRLALLPEEYKRFVNPHIYKVGITGKLKSERDLLIQKHKERSRK